MRGLDPVAYALGLILLVMVLISLAPDDERELSDTQCVNQHTTTRK